LFATTFGTIARLAILLGVLFASAAASAQVPEKRGLFGHIDGRWMWLGGDRVQGASAPTSSGPGGQLLLGYKLDGNWDAALAGDIQTLFTEVTQVRGGTLTTDTNHQHIDLEVGYSQDWWRVNVGLRGARYVQGVVYNTVTFNGYDQRQMSGIGPKAGIGATAPVSENWSLVGSLDGALVYTNFVDNGTGVLRSNGSYWQLVPQLAAEAGVSWRAPGPLSFTTGVRVNLAFNTTIVGDGTSGTLVEYGPFVRLGYNFGGRTPRLPAVQSPEAPTATTRSEVVFFDFGGTTLSAVAQATVRRAAADAQRGQPVNLEIASHAHRAGTAADNLSLSRSRADAVRDELLRNGLGRDQIEMAGPGERDRLAPAPGGLQEARNRRVQVAF
jgi:outer membrane protein OmpA-like peptidoglycan-associated protein